MFEIKGTAEKCREVPKVGREKKWQLSQDWSTRDLV